MVGFGSMGHGQASKKKVNVNCCWWFLMLFCLEFVALCVNLLQLHPCDVDALRLTYLFMNFRKLPFRYLNNVLFHLVALIFTRCTTHFPRAFENAPLIAWLAAGIMSSVAQYHKTLLKVNKQSMFLRFGLLYRFCWIIIFRR